MEFVMTSIEKTVTGTPEVFRNMTHSHPGWGEKLRPPKTVPVYGGGSTEVLKPPGVMKVWLGISQDGGRGCPSGCPPTPKPAAQIWGNSELLVLYMISIKPVLTNPLLKIFCAPTKR
jgi:hypothetical protein